MFKKQHTLIKIGLFFFVLFIIGGVFVFPRFLSADGALVTAFGTGGIYLSNPSSLSDSINKLALDANYLYSVGGDKFVGGYSRWRIEKTRLSDGALCTAANCGTEFGTAGVVVSDPDASKDEIAVDIALDISAGYMYVFGEHHDAAYDREFRVEKRNLSDGVLVGAFGTGGIITTQISTRAETPAAIVVNSSGQYIFISGLDYAAGINPRIRIEKRRTSDGALCTAANCGTEFGIGGVKTDTPTDISGIYDLAIDGTGLYAVGFEKPTRVQWRIEKRNLDSGALIWNQSSSPTASMDDDEAAYNLAIDSSYIYVSGVDRGGTGGSDQWRIEKRNLNDGTLVSSFGTNGSVTIDPSSGHDKVRDLVVNSTGLYVVGHDYSPANGQWRIERRDISDGSVNWVQTSNPSLGDDLSDAVSVDGGGGNIFVGGKDNSVGGQNDEWRIEKRRTAAPASSPTVTTKIATSISSSGAVLNGLANPNNAATTAWFRYDSAIPVSCNDTFGTRVPSIGGTSLGSGSVTLSFFQSVAGLSSSSNYYFCAIAENSSGKTYGAVQTFITAAPGGTSAYGVTREGCELKNWGWGDSNIGWLSFNSTNQYAGKVSGANYGAYMTNFCQNVLPNVPSGLAVSDTSSANWSFNCTSPLQPSFSWIFSDPNTDDSQKAYQVQVDDNSDFTSPEYDSGSVTSTALTTSVPSGRLSYNTSYNWRIKVWDNRKTPLPSVWANGSSFTTTLHNWPDPDFTFSPQIPSAGQDVLFRRDQDSDGDTFGARCFNNLNQTASCTDYFWTMQDSNPAMSNTASSAIPVITSFNSTGAKQVSLKAVDPEGFFCFKDMMTGTVTLPLPEYKEVLPR